MRSVTYLLLWRDSALRSQGLPARSRKAHELYQDLSSTFRQFPQRRSAVRQGPGIRFGAKKPLVAIYASYLQGLPGPLLLKDFRSIVTAVVLRPKPHAFLHDSFRYQFLPCVRLLGFN